MLFYNNRIVKLNAHGILSYTDPKNTTQVRGYIDFKDKNVIVKIYGKMKDSLEIISKDGSFIFKEM